MQAPCGNCGKPVGGSDITCPHCDALLAAYASPSGSMSTATWDSPAPVAHATPPVQITEPAPAPEIDIPEEVEAISSAPRPLFDTNVTIDELMRAAEGDHDENLVVVDEEKTTSRPVEFDGPDYARPPSTAESVPVVENADADLIARPLDESVPPAPPASTADEPAAPAGESWLADAHTVDPAPPRRERRRAREVVEPAATERGHTEEYLRKLHSQTGYNSTQAVRSRPIDTTLAQRTRPAIDPRDTMATIEKSRRGCSAMIGFVLIFLWLGVVGSILTGNVSGNLVFVAVAFTLMARFFGKPLPWTSKR